MGDSFHIRFGNYKLCNGIYQFSFLPSYSYTNLCPKSARNHVSSNAINVCCLYYENYTQNFASAQSERSNQDR
jgi:hypothetical protein